VSVEYTRAAITAFSQLGSTTKPFRFLFMSGILASRDQSKPLWFVQEVRRLKGQAENLLLEANISKPDTINGYVLRPGSVLPKENTILKIILGLTPSIGVEALAAASLELAIKGGDKVVWENGDLVRLGKLTSGERK
jgi:hypothetical protein